MVFQVWGLQNRNGKKTQRIAASNRPTYLESETCRALGLILEHVPRLQDDLRALAVPLG